MTTRTVTGNIKTLTDSAVQTGTVTFNLKSTYVTGSTIHNSGTTTATTDSNGDFSIALAVPASGSYLYEMVLPTSNTPFNFYLSSGDSVNVATLIQAQSITVADDVEDMLAAYLPLAGGTMTGQLNFSGTTHAGLKVLSLTTAQRDALTPANGMIIYNSTDGEFQGYEAGAWATVISSGAVSSVFGRTGAVVAASGDYSSSQITDDSAYGAGGALSDSIDNLSQDIDGKQTASTKLSAIDALTWAANSIILLTGTATAAVQALASHVVTFLQSATAADARTAIGAGTGNGDVTGPASSTDNAIPRFDSTTGKVIQQGYTSNTPTITDDGLINAPGGIEFAAGETISAGGNNTTIAAGGYINLSAGTGVQPNTDNATLLGRQARRWASVFSTGFHATGPLSVGASAATPITNATGDVTLNLTGLFVISDGAGNFDSGLIDLTAPGNTFNLYDDGGTNTCQLAVAADGSVTVTRTAGSRTYTVNLSLLWL